MMVSANGEPPVATFPATGAVPGTGGGGLLPRFGGGGLLPPNAGGGRLGSGGGLLGVPGEGSVFFALTSREAAGACAGPFDPAAGGAIPMAVCPRRFFASRRAFASALASGLVADAWVVPTIPGSFAVGAAMDGAGSPTTVAAYAIVFGLSAFAWPFSLGLSTSVFVSPSGERGEKPGEVVVVVEDALLLPSP